METPQMVGRYEILDRLGAGGMAEVFLARQVGAAGFEKKVALKRLRPNQLENKLLVRSLINEAHLAARLSHSNVVQVFEFELIDDSYCMTMEYIDGLTLDEVLDCCHAHGMLLPPGLLIYIAQEVCAGLAYAHALTDDDSRPLNLVHRDIKPSNIMISRGGQVKLMDFGIAKAASSPFRTTTSGKVKGTLAYMSPEQLASDPLGPPSDLFSLGVTLYEAATLEPLFDDSSLARLVDSIQRGLHGEARERLEACCPRLTPVLERMLKPLPGDRFPDAGAVLRALRPLSYGSSAMEMAAFLGDVAVDPQTNQAEVQTLVMPAEGEAMAAPPPSDGDPEPEVAGLPARRSARKTPRGRRPAHDLSGISLPDASSQPPARHPQRPWRGRVGALAAVGLGLAGVGLAVGIRFLDPSPNLAARDPSSDRAAPDPSSDRAAPDPSSNPLPDAGRGLRNNTDDTGTGSDVGRGLVPRPSGALHGGGQAPALRNINGIGLRKDYSPVGQSEPVAQGPGVQDPRYDRANAENSGQLKKSGNDEQDAPPLTGEGSGERSRQGAADGSGERSRQAPAEQRGKTTTTRAARADASPRSTGRLTINAAPYAQVFVDGRDAGTSPVQSLAVSAGRHDIKLVDAGGREKQFQVEVAPDAEVVRIWSFYEEKWIQDRDQAR